MVVDKLRLDLDPEFSPALRGSGGVMYWISSLLGSGSSGSFTPAERKARERVEITESLLNILSVNVLTRSRLLTISIASPDPKKAAKIANAVAELYLVVQLEAKFEATERATRWLGNRIAALREASNRSEQAVELYRRKHGLVKGKDDTTIATSQITQVSSQLILARAKRAEVEARLAQIEKLLKSKRGIESAAEVLSSALIQRLRERESEVIGKMAELSAVFGRKHPKMLAVRAEMADLRRKIRVEVRKIVQQVRNEAEVAQVREVSLEKSLADLEMKSSRLNEKSIRLRALEREAKANQTLLETVLERFKEATAQKGIQSADARIISPAVVPTKPYFPKIRLLSSLAFLGAVAIAMGLVGLKESLDSVFRSSKQVEEMTGVPVLETIPNIHRKDSKGGKLANFIDNNPLSPFVEALRGLRLSLSLSDVDSPPKSVLVTSASPEEGKSVLAFALARIIAGMPTRTVLVDCDLRRPTLHGFLGVKNTPGIVELLAGEAELSDVLRRDEVSDLHFIPAGKSVPNPGNLLASERMKLLLKALTEKYEMVIIDSPPMLSLNDARILGPSVDCALFVVRWGDVRRETAINAVKKLAESGTRVAGIALNRVVLKKHAQYDYSVAGSFYKRHAKYYTT
jgi:exopolysaccharide transport family protein